MSDVLYFLACLGLVLISVGCASMIAYDWAKPRTVPNHARLIAKPGASLDLVDKDGTVIAKVILRQISTVYRGGTTVEFVDHAKYLEKGRD